MNYKWLGLGAALVLLLNGCGRDLPAPQEYGGDYSRMAYIETAKPLSYGEWEQILSLPEVTDYDLSGREGAVSEELTALGDRAEHGAYLLENPLGEGKKMCIRDRVHWVIIFCFADTLIQSKKFIKRRDQVEEIYGADHHYRACHSRPSIVACPGGCGGAAGSDGQNAANALHRNRNCQRHSRRTKEKGNFSRSAYCAGTGTVSYTHLDVYKRQPSRTVSHLV